MSKKNSDRDPTCPQLRSPSMDRPTVREVSQKMVIKGLEAKVARLEAEILGLKAELKGAREHLNITCYLLELEGLPNPKSLKA